MPKQRSPGRRQATVVVVQLGGLGDLVLTAHLFACLRAAYPRARLLLVCRAAMASIVRLFPVKPDKVLGPEFDPYAWDQPCDELFASLDSLLPQLRTLRPSMLVTAEYRPTWLSWVLNSLWAPRKSVFFPNTAEPHPLLEDVLQHFHLPRREFEGSAAPEALHEPDRYRELLARIDVPWIEPAKWLLPAGLQEPVNATLREFGLESGRYLVCFPGGGPGSAVKQWPLDSFAEALCAFLSRAAMPVLLAGCAAERTRLDDLRRKLGSTAEAPVFAGERDDLPLLAGLVANAAAYLGNDTGPVHIASAFRVPGVSIFGGGHWPAYVPWGPGSIAFAHPLPCFGCNWDCAFGRGLCVELVPPRPVAEALHEVMAGPHRIPEVRTLDLLAQPAADLVRDASRQYREASRDRGERQRTILALRREVSAATTRVAELEHIASERLEALGITDEALRNLRGEAELRETGLRELTAVIEQRDLRIAALESMAEERLCALREAGASMAKLAEEAEKRRQALVELTAVIHARDGRIADLERTAEERLRALREADAAMSQLAAEAEKRRHGLIELTAIIQARDARVADLEATAGERLDAIVKLEDLLRQIRGQGGERRRATEEQMSGAPDEGRSQAVPR
ncbi:MAG: hypothetical protein HYS04_07170 [Acidobacteria bacterium]|nr:hypothetical protein [Acidobacteriota bacterium]